jgi:hypothetical protein
LNKELGMQPPRKAGHRESRCNTEGRSLGCKVTGRVSSRRLCLRAECPAARPPGPGRPSSFGFDDDGRVTARTEAGAHKRAKGLEYPPGVWHALVCLTPDTVLFECKPGPFAPLAEQDFAPWAPPEGSPEAGDYVRWMLRAEPGARYGECVS